MARTRNSTKSSRRRLPRSLDVAGQKVRVRVVDLGGETYGQFTPDDRLIEIDRTHLAEDPDAAWLTFRHELMEATLFLSGVAYLDRYEQEPVVRALEQIFFPVWEKLNPVS